MFFADKLQWLGHLSSDIYYETKSTRFYFLNIYDVDPRSFTKFNNYLEKKFLQIIAF
jgi:hypothetical protein